MWSKWTPLQAKLLVHYSDPPRSIPREEILRTCLSLYETLPRDHSDLKIRGSAYGTLSGVGCHPQAE